MTAESWIAGYEILEGPPRTGVPSRYVGRRLDDGAYAWIRLDAYSPEDLKAALQLARIYTATAGFDHPDLPVVLSFGSTNVPGRPYIAFQLEPEAEHGAGSPETVAEVLAEVNLLAYEAGLGGIHVPRSELDRARAGITMPDRRLPFREFLADPRRPDGTSAFLGTRAEPEWKPFAAPELLGARRGRTTSVRQALTYRVAASVRYLETGALPEQREPAHEHHDADATAAGPLSPETRITRSEAVASGLHPNPSRRPPLESFVA